MIKNEITVTELKAQLDRIESGLIAQKNVFTFPQWCKYCGFSESYGYKLSSQGKIPGMYRPNGKMLYFSKVETDQFLLQNHIKTADAIAKESATHVITGNRKGGGYV